jgi:hypothetical protein
MAEASVEIDPVGKEPELLTFVRDYWDRLRGARAMPGRMDIVPWDMKAHLPHVLLADVIGGGTDFRYRLVGSQLHRYFAGNPTGKLMSETLSGFGKETVDRTIHTYATVATRKSPMRIRGAGTLFAQGPKLFDAMLTPLSDDGVTVNMIFGAFVFMWDKGFEFARGSDLEERELERVLHNDI